MLSYLRGAQESVLTGLPWLPVAPLKLGQHVHRCAPRAGGHPVALVWLSEMETEGNLDHQSVSHASQGHRDILAAGQLTSPTIES